MQEMAELLNNVVRIFFYLKINEEYEFQSSFNILNKEIL